MTSRAGKATRSKTGCQTCRRRRKKCDEGRPKCQLCIKIGIECEGYDKPLIWGNGIASRGKFKGAVHPATAEAYASRTGRSRDKRATAVARDDENASAHLGQSSAQRDVEGQYREAMWSPGFSVELERIIMDDDLITWKNSPEEEVFEKELCDKLMIDFFTFGHYTLYAGSKDDSPVLRTILPMCRTSSTLRSVCRAYQALIALIPHEKFQMLYDVALQRFRADLADPDIRHEDSTIATGILLCSIGASQSFPWTFHIEPLLKLLITRPIRLLSDFRSHALDIMGYYDLPSFVLNRKQARLDIWSTYCGGANRDIDEVEPVSGLPRSLLHIFSRLEEPDCEEKLWLWHGHEGDVLQIYLWDAFRFAGMLKHRELKNDYAGRLRDSGLEDQTQSLNSKVQLPTDLVLLNRLIASINVLYKLQSNSESQPLVMNAIIYPLFIAGSQVKLLQERPEWDELICILLDEMIQSGRRQVEPLREILKNMKSGDQDTPDQMAAKMGLEIALL